MSHERPQRRPHPARLFCAGPARTRFLAVGGYLLVVLPMKPSEFCRVAARVYGQKTWQRDLADALGVNRTTIFRMAKWPDEKQIPGVYEVALNALSNQKKIMDIAAKEARKGMGRHTLLRRRKNPRKPREAGAGQPIVELPIASPASQEQDIVDTCTTAENPTE